MLGTRPLVNISKLVNALPPLDLSPFGLDPGVGKWEFKPRQHTCAGNQATGTVYTFRDDKTLVTAVYPDKWRDTEHRPGCRACYWERRHREARKALFELERLGELYHVTMTAEEYKRFADRLRQQKTRKDIDINYRAYPDNDGNVTVLHDQSQEAGELLPDDRAEVMRLMQAWCDTPQDKRISGSHGWGGPWQGTKGDGRVKEEKKRGEKPAPAVQAWSNSPIIDAAKALHVEAADNVRQFHKKTDPLSAYKSLIDAGILLFERKSNKNALQAMLNAFTEEVVTDKGHIAQDKHMYEIRDKAAHQLELRGQREKEITPLPLAEELFGPPRGGAR